MYVTYSICCTQHLIAIMVYGLFFHRKRSEGHIGCLAYVYIYIRAFTSTCTCTCVYQNTEHVCTSHVHLLYM